MDIIAHGLWTNAAFYKKYRDDKKNRYLAVLFGLLPDLVSFAPSFIALFLTGLHFDFDQALHSQKWFYLWGRESYNYTHSLVVFAAVMAIIAVIRKGKIFWPLAGWGVHVAIDIFSHKYFFQTPFLFPLSDFKISGLSWGQPAFMITNYSVLAVVYLVWFLVLRKR